MQQPLTPSEVQDLEERLHFRRFQLNVTPGAVDLFRDSNGNPHRGLWEDDINDYLDTAKAHFRKIDDFALADDVVLSYWEDTWLKVHHVYFVERQCGHFLYGVRAGVKNSDRLRELIEVIRARFTKDAFTTWRTRTVPTDSESEAQANTLTLVNGREVHGEHIRVLQRRERIDMRVVDAITGENYRRTQALHQVVNESFIASNFRNNNADVRDRDAYEHIVQLTNLTMDLAARLSDAESALRALSAAQSPSEAEA